MQTVNIVNWTETAIQLIGYRLTWLNYASWNVYAFLIGIFLWFAVGFMWKDKLIMLGHVGAFSPLVGDLKT